MDQNERAKLFELGVEILSRLESENKPGLKSSPPIPAYPVADDNRDNLFSTEPWRPEIRSVQQIIDEFSPLQPCSILVGVCMDGYPIFMDLLHSTAGSLIMVGEDIFSTNRLISMMLSSARITTPARKLRYSFINSSSTELDKHYQSPHFYQSHRPFEPSAGDFVRELSCVVEQRRFGREKGPLILLAIEDLEETIGYLGEEARNALAWLIQNGPACGVYTLAGVSSGQLELIPSGIMEAFGTHISSQQTVEAYSPGMMEASLPQDSDLASKVEYWVQIEDEWTGFMIPVE